MIQSGCLRDPGQETIPAGSYWGPMFWILLTPFFRSSITEFVLTSSLFIKQIFTHPMDPRRARDPRLTRTDPRLQRQHGQPGPSYNAPPPPYPNYPPQGHGNGGLSYVPPQAPQMQQQYSSGPVSNHQLREEAEGASSLPPPATASQPQTQPATEIKTKQIYKPRPLFCVVCASNQVRVAERSDRYPG